MRCLLYTDPHFSQYSSIVRKRDNPYSLRLKNEIESISWAEEQADKYNCDKIICLGDFFDRADLNAEEITALQDITWSSKPHYFLVGNHEMGINDLSFSSAHLLKMIPDVQVIDKPDMICGFGYELIFLPYMLESNRKTISEYVNKVTSDFYRNTMITQEVKNRIILSHNDISGIRYGQIISKIGFDIKDIEDNCSLYINGHLHNQQQVSDKIFNLGNLTGQNFSEDAEKYNHCIGILDTATMKLDLIVNPYALNFYKLEMVEDYSYIKLKDKLETFSNAIVSLKIPQSKITEVKELLSTLTNIVEYRLISVNDVSD